MFKLLGDLPAFRADPLGFVATKLTDATGPVRVRFAHQSVYLVADPGSVQEVLVTNRDHFDKGLEVERLGDLFGISMVTARNGQRWEASRAAMRAAFSPAYLAEGFALSVGELQQFVAQLAASRLGGRIDVHEQMGKLALKMSTAALFQRRLSPEAVQQVYAGCQVAHARISESMWRTIDLDTLLPTMARRRFQKAVAGIKAVAAQTIGEAALQGRADAEATALVVGASDLARQFGPQAALDEAVGLLVAGFETTGSTAAWLVYALASRPDLVEWLREEVDGLDDLTAETLRRLPRTRALVLEVLRLFPSAWWFARRAVQESRVSGQRIPAGATVLILPWMLHRQASLWKDPEQFEPRRWLTREDPGVTDKWGHIPFGAGPRACIGQHLAQQELAAIAIAMATAFDLKAVGAAFEGRSCQGGVTLSPPAGGLQVAVSCRSTRARAA